MIVAVWALTRLPTKDPTFDLRQGTESDLMYSYSNNSCEPCCCLLPLQSFQRIEIVSGHERLHSRLHYDSSSLYGEPARNERRSRRVTVYEKRRLRPQGCFHSKIGDRSKVMRVLMIEPPPRSPLISKHQSAARMSNCYACARVKANGEGRALQFINEPCTRSSFVL